jgi:hypothetical protein
MVRVGLKKMEDYPGLLLDSWRQCREVAPEAGGYP